LSLLPFDGYFFTQYSFIGLYYVIKWKYFKDRALAAVFYIIFSESGCKGTTFFLFDKLILKKYFGKWNKRLGFNEK
jgi:hypothetical protein